MCHRNRAAWLSTDEFGCYDKKNSKKLKLELQTIDRIITFQMNITENVCLMTEKGRSLSIMIEDLKGFVIWALNF